MFDSTDGVGERWLLEREVGSAAAFHARDLPQPAERRVSVLDVERPALVLGSTQPEDHVDAGAVASAGAELVRRRSGGGAVLVEPGRAVWIDVVVPRGDRLWVDDVGRATFWLGATWVEALDDLGVPAVAHRGRMVTSPWSSRVCFAGLGPGEVQVQGRKAVGISQRRGRSAARFQCVVLDCWEPEGIVGFLALSTDVRTSAAAELAGVATGVDRPLAQVIEAFVTRLPW